MSLVHNIVGGAGGGKPSPTDAVLRVKAPSGSTVTIKKGTGASITPNFYLDGTDTDTFFFYIKASNFGTYTVTATLGDDTATDTITIELPQEYSIELLYGLYLYKDGEEYISVTGGWLTTFYGSGGSVTKNANNIRMSAYRASIYTSNKVDFIGYSTLCVHFTEVTKRSGTQYAAQILSVNDTLNVQTGDAFAGITPKARVTSNVQQSDYTMSVDVSVLQLIGYVSIKIDGDNSSTYGIVDKIWLEH